MKMLIDGTLGEIQSLLSACELRRRLNDLLASEDPEPRKVEPLRRELAAALAPLPPGFAERLERLLGRARPPAIPLDSETHCPACHIRFPVQLEFKVRKRSVLFACLHCGRLLSHLATPPAAPKPPASRAASRARKRPEHGKRAHPRDP